MKRKRKMKIPNVCSIENIRDELCAPRLENRYDMSFVPIKFMYIKKLINVVLDLYNVQYTQWSAVFRDAARAHNLLHHIDPAIINNIDHSTTLWRRQEAIVLSWIYATISPYLLVRLVTETRGTISAINAWEFLRDMCEQYSSSENKRKRRFIHVDLDENYQRGVDLISNLPDELLVCILSLVADMKSVGRTCLLSKRWTRLWTYLKHLDFGEPETLLNYTWYPQSKMDKFVERVNRVIIANRAPYLDAFRIKFPLNSFYSAHIQSWLKFAFDKQVCNLDLDFLDMCYPPIHFSNIFSTDPALILNTTLTSLHLKSVTLKGPFLQWVLTNCINLQHLLFHRCKASSDDDTASSMHHRRLVVSSPQLRHLEFYHSLKSLNIQVLCLSAPNLTSFIIYESKYEVEYRSVPSLVDATFGWLYCHHLFKNQDSISSFSFQLQKLSIWWHMEHTVYSQFPNFANVQQLEIISKLGHGDLILATSLIEACPLLHTFKLKMMCSYELESTRQISAPDYAQENAIRCHQHLKVVEYLGYEGCASAAELAVCLARHAPMLQRFIFDTRRPHSIESLCRGTASDYRDKVAIAKKTELLAKRIQRRQFPLDVVIL